MREKYEISKLGIDDAQKFGTKNAKRAESGDADNLDDEFELVNNEKRVEKDKSRDKKFLNREKVKEELLELLREKLKVEEDDGQGNEKRRYTLSNQILLNYFEKTDLLEIIRDEKALNHGESSIKTWIKGKNVARLLFGIREYKEQLLSEFFGYADDGGIIKETHGPLWGHIYSGLWFLSHLAEENIQKKKNIIEAINIRDSRESIIRLAELKIGRGIKLIEKAGESYATLIAFLGGEGTFVIRDRAGIIPPADIDDCVTEKDKQKLLDSYIKSGSNKGINFIDANTEFKKNNYDIYMAINHGNCDGDKFLNKEAIELLKNDKKENCLIIYQENKLYVKSRNKK